MKDIMDMLRGMDKKQLDDMMKKARDYIKTPEGRELAEKLRNGESADKLPFGTSQQNEMLSRLSKQPDIAKKISEILEGKK